MTFLAKRLAGFVAVALASSLLTFALLELAPGDFLSDARLHPQLSEQSLATLRARYGLDRSLAHKYGLWLQGLVRGDWGRSLARDLPVFPLLTERAAHTVALALGAQAIAWASALGFGFLALQRPGGWLDRIVDATAGALLSVPEIAIALLAILALARAGWGFAPGLAATAALALSVAPALWRQTRAALLRASAETFVEAARANRLSERVIFTYYILPAAAPAMITLAGVSIGGLLSASLLVECVTSYPGLGPLLLEAVFARDAFLVVGAVFLSTLLWALGSFLADVAHWLIDPRVRISA